MPERVKSGPFSNRKILICMHPFPMPVQRGFLFLRLPIVAIDFLLPDMIFQDLISQEELTKTSMQK